MDNVINITELQNIEAVAMKYIVKNLGFNIRPCKAVLTEEGMLKIPLQAIVPRRVTKRDAETKVFVYRLDDVGHLIYKETDSKFEFVSSISARNLEGEITQRFTNLTENIEKEILKEGRMNWGKLTWIRTFLRPLYSIIIELVTSPKVSVDSLDEIGKWGYARLLINEGYAKLDKYNPKQLIPTNKLEMIAESNYRENRVVHDVAEEIVGIVFSNNYTEIKKEFRINSPTAYVDTTKIYYIDALRYGENIPIHEDNLLYEYLKIGDRVLRPEITKRQFKTLLCELEAVNLLEQRGDYISGKPTFFNNLLAYRNEILEGSIEAPKVAGI